MTYEKNNNSNDFLLINYDKTDFLINKNQFSSSILLENWVRIKSRLKYFTRIVKYNRIWVPLFNFNQYLKDTFKLETNNMSNLVLIINIKKFMKKNKIDLYKFYDRNDAYKLSKNYIALLVNSNSEIKSLNIDDLKPIPPMLRYNQLKYGILGLRFFNTDKIQYFLDLEKIIFDNKLYLIKKEKAVENV